MAIKMVDKYVISKSKKGDKDIFRTYVVNGYVPIPTIKGIAEDVYGCSKYDSEKLIKRVDSRVIKLIVNKARGTSAYFRVLDLANAKDILTSIAGNKEVDIKKFSAVDFRTFENYKFELLPDMTYEEFDKDYMDLDCFLIYVAENTELMGDVIFKSKEFLRERFESYKKAKTNIDKIAELEALVNLSRKEFKDKFNEGGFGFDTVEVSINGRNYFIAPKKEIYKIFGEHKEVGIRSEFTRISKDKTSYTLKDGRTIIFNA